MIGAAYDIVNGLAQAGSFNVLYGSDAGLNAAR